MPQIIDYTVSGSTENEEWIVVHNSDANLTVTDGNTVVLATSGTGNVSIFLPAAADNVNRVIIVKKMDSANTVTIDPNASETVDGNTTHPITTQYESVIMSCDGSNWNIVN